MTVKEFSENELLFNKLYEKTKDCGRIQFVNLLMQAERENQELNRQLEYLYSGEYLNQLKFERNMLQDVVNKMQVSKEDKKFIDMTHRNTQLLEENRKYEEVIDKLKNIINEMINCGYVVENGESAVNYIATGGKSEFGTRAKVLLDILKEVE